MAGTTASPSNDQAFVSTACPADVALVHNGPSLTTFRIRNTMRVPAEFHFDRMVRSEQFVELVIDSLVSLRPGAGPRRGADHHPQHGRRPSRARAVPQRRRGRDLPGR